MLRDLLSRRLRSGKTRLDRAGLRAIRFRKLLTEVLEDRRVLSTGQWLLRLEGLPGETTQDQTIAARNLLNAAGIADVVVVGHAGWDGNILVQPTEEVSEEEFEEDLEDELLEELEEIPGFLGISEF